MGGMDADMMAVPQQQWRHEPDVMAAMPPDTMGGMDADMMAMPQQQWKA